VPAPVVVVGAGPTGVLAALGLAVHGVEVLLLERHEAVWALPRAVHLDDEAVRLLQGVGVAQAFAGLSRPARGLRLLHAGHGTMAEFPRDPEPGAHGHPQANLFDQPDLERVLRERLAACPGARLRTSVEVLAVENDPAHPQVRLRDTSTGRVEVLEAAAVLGCDGADSVVRRDLGAGWQELGRAERWFVVDVRCPVPLDAWEGVHQVCDPSRAATFLQVGDDRYRWEFALHDGESAAELARRLPQLVQPWTREVPVARLEVLRSSEYVFAARVADRWRAGRVFLLGDAAHQTPPFVGQGLASGVRDAANLTWKLAAVLQARAPEALLDTYEAERRPHARALVRLAVTAGWAMTGGGGRAAAVRRTVLAGLCRVPGAPQRLLDRGTPPLARGPLVPRSVRRGQRLAGRLAPQPRLRAADGGPDGPLLDDVLGPGFAVLTTVVPDAALERLAAQLRAPLLRVGHAGTAGPDGTGGTVGPGRAVDDGGVLAAWLDAGGACAVVLRPDRVVLAGTRSRTAPGAELEHRHGRVLRLVGA
jgi:3-(3-hydroxy-phenyl)propionate hydroxylase